MMFCAFDIYQNGQSALRESRREVDRDGHKGTIYELGIPEGLSLGYYKIHSRDAGMVTIDNASPFLQLSHTISGQKSYRIDGEDHALVAFHKQEYNYLFLTAQKVHLHWEPGEVLEVFELGISPELMLRSLPEDHPIYPAFK